MARTLLGCIVLATGLWLPTSTATARVEGNSAYTKAQTASCALRFLRVDRGYEVTEKDLDAAYVLFRYPIPGRKAESNGSLEVVDTGSGVKVIFQLAQLPSSHEALLRDGLLRKLRDEYGPPPSKPAPKPAPAKPPVKPSDPGDPDDSKDDSGDPKLNPATPER